MAFLCGPQAGVTGRSCRGIFSRLQAPTASPLCRAWLRGIISQGRPEPLLKPLSDPCLNSFLGMNCSPDLSPALGAILCASTSSEN